MRPHHHWPNLVLAASLVVTGCSSSESPGTSPAADSGAPDATSVDSSVVDSGGVDSTSLDSAASDADAIGFDASDASDASAEAADPDAADASPPDTTGPDTAPLDAGPDTLLEDRAKAADALALAMCTRLRACNLYAFSTRWTDLTTCAARTRLELLDRLGAANTGDSVSAFQACTTAWTSFSCENVANNDVPTDCRRLGTRPLSEPCTWHTQCGSGYCARPTYLSCGLCRTQPSRGADCSDLVDCGYGQACIGGVCVAQRRAGEPCDAAPGSLNVCGPGLGCSLEGPATVGVCSTPLPTGGICQFDIQCDVGNGYACRASGSYSVCVRLSTASVDSACPDRFTACLGGAACFGGKCVANAADGSPCSEVSGPRCSPPAVCDNATNRCKVPAASLCY